MRQTIGYLILFVLMISLGPISLKGQQGGRGQEQLRIISVNRISVDSQGNEGNRVSGGTYSSLSANGRFVAFDSWADNLVVGDRNWESNIFVRDQQTRQTTNISISREIWGNYNPSISADGRFVAFRSTAGDLVAGDNNGSSDVFVHDRQTGRTTRVSLSFNGEEGNGGSFSPSISADGRFVAFNSSASNLIAEDNNGVGDVFVHDRQTGQTVLVSLSSNGEEGNNASSWPSISADGRFVAFNSSASNLIAEDNNGVGDVFVHDRQTGQTVLVSLHSGGGIGNGSSLYPSISANGRFVAFHSEASNLVAEDNNRVGDVFVHDRRREKTTRVSLSETRGEGNGVSSLPSINANGRFVAFVSNASDLVAGDNNRVGDIFVHDRQTNQTIRVSIPANGKEGNGESFSPSISADGRFVAFASNASDLVAGDNNRVGDVFIVKLHLPQVGLDGRAADNFGLDFLPLPPPEPRRNAR